ncbi:hypothetical protein B8W96_12460, partial [Lentilactobacillus parakefiri]
DVVLEPVAKTQSVASVVTVVDVVGAHVAAGVETIILTTVVTVLSLPVVDVVLEPVANVQSVASVVTVVD